MPKLKRRRRRIKRIREMDMNMECSIPNCKNKIKTFCGCDVCADKPSKEDKRCYCSEKCHNNDIEHFRAIGFWCNGNGRKKNNFCGLGDKKYNCPPRENEPKHCSSENTKTTPIVAEIHRLKQSDLKDLSHKLRMNEKMLIVCGVEVRITIKYFDDRFEISAWHGEVRFYHKILNYITGKAVGHQTVSVDGSIGQHSELEPLSSLDKGEEIIKEQKELEEEEGEGEEEEEEGDDDNEDNNGNDGIKSSSDIFMEIINVPHVSKNIYVSWIRVNDHLHLIIIAN